MSGSDIAVNTPVVQKVAKNLAKTGADVQAQGQAMLGLTTGDGAGDVQGYGATVVFGHNDSDTRALGTKYNDMITMLAQVGKAFGQSIAEAAQSLDQVHDNYTRTDAALAGE